MLTSITASAAWNYTVLGNTTGEYITTLLAFVGFIVVFKIVQLVIVRRMKRIAERTTTDIDDLVIQIAESVRPPFYAFISFYLALTLLSLNVFLQKMLYALLLAWLVYQVITTTRIVIDYAFRKTVYKTADKGTRAAVSLIDRVIKGALWALGILIILSNLGVNVTSLVAGLGIGGLAFALAAQNILGDLFSSFAILFDKPFVPGDFIVVGEHKGTVEKIGIKTTRIKSLHGEEIVISNQELTSARVQNFKKLSERRISFSFGVLYETPSEKFEKIPGMIKKIINANKDVRFDRTHFSSFDDSALTFEVVYYVLSPDYKVYANTHEKILFAIKRTFENDGIGMAYPTRTVYMHKA